jgi:hypothetical protein
MHPKKLFIIIIILLLGTSPAFSAGDSTSITRISSHELTNENIRIPDKNFFTIYLIDKDYSYKETDKITEKNGIFYILWRWFLYMIRRTAKALSYLPLVLKILSVVVIFVLIYFIVSKTKLYTFFYSDKEIPLPELTEGEEYNEDYDFNKAISLQISLGNFRNAIRLLHLKVLKELEIREMIQYAKDKTNREYTKEIADAKMRSDFSGLTRIYNAVWYGNYFISGSEFEQYSDRFNQFIEGIDATKK